MSKFKKGDKFRCEDVFKNAIFTIKSITYIRRRIGPSQTAEGLPNILTDVSYSYCAVTHNEHGKPSKSRVFSQICEPIMIAV